MGYDAFLKDITGIEFRGRTTHTSTSGVEVQRRYWCEPFVAWENIVTAVEGWCTPARVLDFPVGMELPAERHLPATDAFFDNNLMYAVEVRVEHVDQEGIANSPTLSLNIAEVGDIPGDPDRNKKKAIEAGFRDEGKKEQSWGGCFITIIYRSRVTALLPNDSEQGTVEDDLPFRLPTHRAFDFLDVQWKLNIVNVAWPDGIVMPAAKTTITRGYVTLPPELASPIAVPVFDISIRRSLVPKIPIDTINLNAGSVNKQNYSFLFATEGKAVTNLPTFPAETLRFMGATIEPKIMSQRSAGQRQSFDIINHFKYIAYEDNPVYDVDTKELRNNKDGSKGIVTWNHTLASPRWTNLGDLVETLVGQLGRTGWHRTHKREFLRGGASFFGSNFTIGKPLYDTVTSQSFDLLFDINSP